MFNTREELAASVAAGNDLSLDGLRQALAGRTGGDVTFAHVLAIRGMEDRKTLATLEEWAGEAPITRTVRRDDVPALFASRLAERARMSLDRVKAALTGAGEGADRQAVRSAMQAAGWLGNSQERTVLAWAQGVA